MSINCQLKISALQTPMPLTYHGKILDSDCSRGLKERLSEAISIYTRFDQLNTAVIPYIAAWHESEKSIWYEFMGQWLPGTLQCQPNEVAQKFRRSIVARRIYKETISEKDALQKAMGPEALAKARPQLRLEVKSLRKVEAVYQLQLPDSRFIWLKDLAVVESYEKDQFHHSLGSLIDVTKEMETETVLKQMDEALRRSQEKLLYQVTHDNLTGLRNRRYLYKALHQLIKESDQTEQPLALLFFDLDNFKKVVDTHGHLAASRVIREVGATIQEVIESPAFGVAYAGDEFIVVLPRSDRRKARQVAEQIRNKMQQTAYLSDEGLDLDIRASFGFALYPENAQDLTSLLALADQAMFSVKARGKDSISDSTNAA